MSAPRASIRRYSKKTVLPPATVRLMPINELPATFVQCSSICMRPGAVSQSPLIQAQSSLLKDCAGFSDWLASMVDDCVEISTTTSNTVPSHNIPNVLRCIFFFGIYPYKIGTRILRIVTNQDGFIGIHPYILCYFD